jgi:Flp pilus assembly protein TadG
VSTGPRRRRSSGQALSEFALVAPVLLLVLFGVVDFGRAMYYYITLNQASNEGVRVAVRASNYIDANNVRHSWPTDDDVLAAVQAHAPSVLLANPCANGPINQALVPPPNTGWIYITDSTTSDGSGTPNAPAGGGGSFVPGPGCSTPVPAANNYPLKVTIRYNFVPMTPLLSQAVGNRVILTAYAVYRTEY